MPDTLDSFVAKITEAQQGLFALIVSLTGNVDDAHDVLQETNMVLWRKRDEFQQETSFWHWACQIAKFQTMAHFKKKKRGRVSFDSELMDRLADDAAEISSNMLDRQRALENCLGEMPPQSRELVQLRYEEALSSNQVAAKLRRNPASIYDALYRIRLTLAKCIERTLQREGR